MSDMRRVVAVFHDHPTDIYTLDRLETSLGAAGSPIKRKTLRKYLERLQGYQIVEKLRGDKGETVFRCKSPHLARAYLEHQYADYAGRVAPRTSPTRPLSAILHRGVYPIMLSGGELQRVIEIGDLKHFGRTPPYYHVVTDGFNMKAWKSGKARVFLKDDWRGDMRTLLGEVIVSKVEAEVKAGNGHVGIARPPPLPTGRIIKIVEPDGSITINQYGFSQLKDGEWDRHGKQDAPNGDRVETWLWDENKFKADVSNGFQGLDSRLAALSERLDMMPQAIGDAVKKALEEVLRESYNGSKAPVAVDDISYR